MTWVSVSEAVPTYSKTVVVYRASHKRCRGPVLAYRTNSPLSPWFYLNGDRLDFNPTHWHSYGELPKPPVREISNEHGRYPTNPDRS